MWACCAVVLLPIVAVMVAGGSLSGQTGNVWALVPLVLCVGAHFVMHRMMGNSCHEAPKEDHSEAQRARPARATNTTAAGA
jgi:hypothetical protein